MKRNFLFWVLLVVIPCYAGNGKIQTLKKVRGEYALNSDSNVTPAEAKERARNEAKNVALESAFGVSINSWAISEVSLTAGTSFNSLSIIQTSGEIVDFEIIKEGYEDNPVRGIVFYCIADVKVRKGVEPDPNFTAAIDGIRAHYRDGEKCSMTIRPSQKAYLKVFFFENTETGYYLYPGGENHGLLLEADKTIKIPRHMDPYIQMETDKVRESNTFVILLTKEEYPFNVINPSRADIDRYIAGIPNNMKYVLYQKVEVTK